MEYHLKLLELLATADSKYNSDLDFKKEHYFFKGDLCQLVIANEIANSFGFKTSISCGIPYLTSKTEYDEVIDYIIKNEEEGWWHYVTKEEYHEIKQQN